MVPIFNPPSSDKQILESGATFTPKFDEHGLVTAVVTEAEGGQLLMVAHMNAEALSLTIDSGIAHFFSRSRRKIWKKGEVSGNLQSVIEIRTDCDQDAIWLKVKVSGHGATCHTGRVSCFYRQLIKNEENLELIVMDDEKHFDPDNIYSKN